MGNGTGSTRQPGEHGSHHIAKVVVRDGIAGKPGIMRREGWRAQDGVDEHQFHRFFGAGQFRVAGAREGEESKGYQEQAFN